jgi:hypothetical protein
MNKSKQKGFMDIGRGWTGYIITLILISAVVGWGVIEGILWVFSHITIGLI